MSNVRLSNPIGEVVVSVHAINAEDFGALIRRLRAQMKVSQAEFAMKLKVSTRTVARWEKGETTARNREQLAALGALIHDHLGEDEYRDFVSALDDQVSQDHAWLTKVAALSTLAGPLGLLVSPLGATFAALAAANGRSKTDFRTQAPDTTHQRIVSTMFEDAANLLGVDSSQLLDALLPTLEAAKVTGMSLDQTIDVLKSLSSSHGS